ncbi:MAG TPA: hypothetical protein VJ969_01430, partial [Desulfopila sp.]|nr:hypothetical protein [Desulfopila sp.]
NRAQGTLGIGDNGGRPTFWSAIPQFERAKLNDIPLLRGSDPLAVSETRRSAGSFGTVIRCEFDSEHPCRSLLKGLKNNDLERFHFGTLEQPAQFLKDQIALRFY